MCYFLTVTDHLGSVRGVTDTDGNELQALDYYPYGQVTEKSGSSSGYALNNIADSLDDVSQPYRFNGKESQEFAWIPYLDYGARYYSPDATRWTTMDPLAEKYYFISPYAFCSNNPVNFVDPDGERWVDRNGHLVWDNGDWTEYASDLHKEVGNTLLRTITGRLQFYKLVDSKNNVIVEFDASEGVKPGLYGSTEYNGHIYNLTSKRYRPKSDILITIYSQNAKLRSANSNGFLTQIEAMAINLGHEIEHTTDEAIEMNVNRASIEDKEREASKISRQLISEYEMRKNLKEIQSFYDMINKMALSSTD